MFAVSQIYPSPGEKPPEILPTEARVTTESMKKDTSPGRYNMTTEFHRAGRQPQFTCTYGNPYDVLPSKRKNPRPMEDVAHSHPAQER